MKTSDEIALASNDLLLAKALQQIVDLKDYLAERDLRYEQRFHAQEAAVISALAAQKELTGAAFASSEKAITKADINSEKWMLNANEWRASMLDREEKFASRIEMNAKLESLSTAIVHLEKSNAASQAKGEGKHVMWGYIVAAVSFLGMLITIGVALIRFAK